MQEEWNAHQALHEIEIDISSDTRLITSITCRLETTFEELHYIICQNIHLHPKHLYRFFVPRIHTALRYLPRSKDLHASKKLLSLISVGDDISYRNGQQKLRLKVRSIGMEIDKINIERDLRRAVVALKDTVAKTTYMKKSHIQRENLTLLYSLGSDLIQKQVQHLIADQSVLVFNLKGNNLMAYCLVTRTHDQIEYFFFSNQAKLERYLSVKQNAYVSNLHKEKYKDGMAFVLSKKQLKENDVTSPFNSQMYVEHSCYIYFYDVRRGYDVDVVNNTQAKEFMRYLIALQKALVKMQTFSLEFANQNVSLYIGYNPHTKATLLQTGQKIQAKCAVIPYDNSDNIEHLQGFVRTIDTIELDYFLCVKQQPQYKDERATYMLEGVCFGREFKRVKSELYESEEQVNCMMVDLLLDAIEETGIPQKVIVREQAVYGQISNFCEQLGIVVEIYARLPKIDAFHQSRLKQR